ncbi:hypothetical protein GCT13_19210 [Paraburkholderia sp. CNPSo 3157]|uniref:Uncharacterized protein n=1 Tax=Paraburkholderia franconis TaxID=2654983 RepID=A0A7X1NCH0_9BURK|nr:hypothetical protein [Paraburkholderia franconis]MPW18968.1 hypothetical protein [Paraburkholderia franconis]
MARGPMPAACDFITVISIPFLMRFNSSGHKLLNPGFNREHTVRFHGRTIALSLSIVYVLSKRRHASRKNKYQEIPRAKMNPVVERDLMHIGQVMRATVVQWAPEIMLVDYWPNPLKTGIQTPRLTEYQLNTLLELMHELDEIERRKNRKIPQPIRHRESNDAVESL